MAQSKLMTQAIWKTVYYLVDEGIKIIEDARSSKDTQNISGTQFDSYGLAVFYNGKLYYSVKSSDPSKNLTNQKRSIETIWGEENGRHRGWGDIPAGTGREWAKMFVDEIKRSSQIPDKGFALVIFNAAFYSSIQEGTGKWKILSQVVGDIKNLQSKFKGSTIRPIGNISIG